MTISNGQVYLTGQLAVTPPSGETTAHDGYVQAIDPDTGAVSWSRQIQGVDREASFSAVAVSQTGTSVLDKLGLPQGTIDYTISKTVVANSSVRVGDQFSVRVSGIAKTVTIEAGDTLKLLAEKIARASGFTDKAEIITVDGVQKIKVTPVGKAQIEIEAGKTGRNGLAALGLAEGLISTAPLNAADAKKAKTTATYGLGLPSTLALDTEAQAKLASQTLIGAAMAVKEIYTSLITPVKDPAKASTPVPAYLTAQIANYRQALARLGG